MGKKKISEKQNFRKKFKFKFNLLIAQVKFNLFLLKFLFMCILECSRMLAINSSQSRRRGQMDKQTDKPTISSAGATYYVSGEQTDGRTDRLNTARGQGAPRRR